MRLEEKKENSEYDGPRLSSEPHPWLVICPSRKTQTFFSISEDQSYKRSIHELCNTIICASAQEWLVLEDFVTTDCYLWNPISNDKIQLPSLPYNDNDNLQCLLSAPPNDPECCVLFLIHETTPDDDDDDDDNSNDDTDNKNSNDDTDTNDDDDDRDNEESDDNDDTDNEYTDDEDMNDGTDPDDDDTDSNDDGIDNENLDTVANPDDVDVANNDDENVPAPALYLCKPGYDEEFHKQDLKSIIGDDHFSGWTVFMGNFYILTWQTDILLRLDVDDSSGTISATPMTNQPPSDYFRLRQLLDMPYTRSYLFQSSFHDEKEVELLYVHILLYGRTHVDVYKITVFQFDFVKAVWEEVKSIGERAIFLGISYGGTTCCTRGTNIQKESIYFTKSGYLYIFNLETQSISLSLPCPEISVKYPRSY